MNVLSGYKEASRFLDQLLDVYDFEVPTNVYVIAHQHILPSLIPLFEYLSTHICKAKNVYLLGKPYSTIPSAKNALNELGVNVFENNSILSPGNYVNDIKSDIATVWSSFQNQIKTGEIEKLILLDEGGYLTTSVPNQLKEKTIAVEQTRFGARLTDIAVPTIQVASSVAKLLFESEVIINGVWRRMEKDNLLNKRCRYGIIGLGFLGKCLAKRLCHNGYKVLAFDKVASEDKTIETVLSIQQLVDASDFIIGCTGTNSLPSDVKFNAFKTLISISSADIEFSEIMKTIKVERFDIHQKLVVKSYDSNIEILNGGFPYNFDGTTEYEKTSEIILTRMLMIAAVSQALKIKQCSEFKIPLDISKQKRITDYWAKNLMKQELKAVHQNTWWEIQQEQIEASI